MKNTSQPLIITCALTGAETTQASQPALPITPAEQASAAAEAVAAGASIIHLHVRDEAGKPTQSVDRFEEAITLIRKKAPGVIIQISTGGALGESVASRAAPLRLKPEMASLNLGSLNFGDELFANPPKEIAELAAAIKKNGVIPELEIYETGMLESVARFEKAGVISPPHHFQFVLGVPGGMSGSITNLLHLVSLLPPGASWGVAGVGRFQLPVAVHALLLGGNVRVGFEDNIFYQKGVLAQSNGELVARVSRVARECGREVASVAQTRKLLGL